MSRIERIGDATLFLGDCREVLQSLPKAQALITDPPYGINAARDRKSQKWGWRDYPSAGWDVERPSRETFDQLMTSAKLHVIWGGNYFTDYLPPSSHWLIWDKCQSDFSLADAELAWCSFGGAVRRFNYPRARAMQDGKEHPTQKPVEVMIWTLQQALGGGDVIDPFMGSGTTGVACAKRGHSFTGIEVDPVFFDIACRRIEEAYRQPRLFEEPAPKPVQGSLLDSAA